MTQTASFAVREEAPEEGVFVIAVDGEADMTTAVKFNESFFSAARSGVRRVVADLTDVSFIDTTMLNALVVGHRRMMRDHGHFAVVGSGPRVSRVLRSLASARSSMCFVRVKTRSHTSASPRARFPTYG